MLEDRSIVDVPDLHNDSVLYFRVQDIHAAQQELERRGVTFTGAPHMIYKHPDGLEEWLTFFHEPGWGPAVADFAGQAVGQGCESSSRSGGWRSCCADDPLAELVPNTQTDSIESCSGESLQEPKLRG